MTLSLQNSPSPWNRTLPKPSIQVSGDDPEAYTHRSASLLQHHIVGNQLFRLNNNYYEDNGRRSTVACMPVTRISDDIAMPRAAGLIPAALMNPREELGQRDSPVISTEDTSRSSSPTSTSPVEGSNQLCLCQREPKIPRPRNAFILYRQHHHAAVVAQNPGLSNPDISKIIGEQWRQLSDKAKEEWKALAEDEKARHSQQYPDYRYKPRRHVRFGGQSSASGPSPVSTDTPEPCQKCGGKPMHTPQTPFTPQTPVSHNMPPTNSRMSTAQMVSPPHSGRMRQYTDLYGRTVPPLHDPRFQYGAFQHRIDPSLEGPETKKRRFNGEAVYAPARSMYAEQNYQRSPHERTMSNAMTTGQFHRPNMGPPSRTGFPVQAQQGRSTQAPQHRRDPSLTLPPLKTPLSQQVPVSLSAGPHSQKSGVEAMIMSIPILNKVKILSQIAPILTVPGPASPPREIKGAIIAVEGMDSKSVYNMTNTLAEQLEREGKFAVRIFGGPDPYAALASSNRASNGDGEQLSVSGFLDIISQWHKISKEMRDYVTTLPRFGGDTPDDVIMQDSLVSSTTPEFSSLLGSSNQATRPRSPFSAVSPKTITQTADLSLKSPPAKTSTEAQQSDQDCSVPPTPKQKSRIPASAIAEAQAETEVQAGNLERSESITPHASTTQSPDQPAKRSTSVQPSVSGPLIPIAIVPHYQLTTVDASSIAMPITDAYSPHSHWQWLATLWRGCVGPDVTVIIQSGDMAEEGDQSAGTGRVPSQAFAAAPPQHQSGHQASSAATTHRKSISQQQLTSPQQDVEVRLLDCRAVVVRSGSSGSNKGKSDWEGSEWWEKAKRRVGFEVEEFLRR